MKILFVLEHFYPYIGGAEKLFYELTSSLVKNGFDIKVVTTRYDKSLPAKEIHNGIEIIRVNCFNRFGFTFLSLPQIMKHAKGCSYIHTTTYNAALPAIFVGKLMRKPVFVTFHEVWGDLWSRLPFTTALDRKAFYLFEKLLLKLPFHKFIAVSEFTKSKLIEYGVPAEKVVRIYNGIDYDQFTEKKLKPKAPFTYTYFGRLGISKGLDLLIPAAAMVRKSYPDTKLKLIIPQQPKKIYNQIKELISSYQLDSFVEIHHNLPKSELSTELLSSDCIVIPSYSEGFCFAAAETVAFKIPIISSHQGALQEVVSGTYIAMEDMTVESLFASLENALNGDWTVEPMKHFHLSTSVNEYEELYQTSVEKSTKSQ